MSSRKIFFSLTTLLLLTASTASSQMQFARALDLNTLSPAVRIIRTSDGGYAIVSGTHTYGAGEEDVLVTKTDDAGRVLWSTTVGWEGRDCPITIVEDEGGGFLVGGWTESVGAGGRDILLIKLDGAGNCLGAKTLGWAGGENLADMIRTADGGYALIGTTSSASATLLFIKLNGFADPQYSQVIDPADLGGSGVSLIQTSDLGYSVIAYVQITPYLDIDVLLIKLNISGGHMWTWKYGGAGDDRPKSFLQTGDGGWIIVGNTNSYGSGLTDIMMIKVSNTGAPIWTRAVGRTRDDISYQVTPSTTGYAVVGQTWSFGGDYGDALIAQFDPAWNLSSCWRVATDIQDYARGAAPATHGGFVTAGIAFGYGTGMMLMKFDEDGETCIGESVTLNVGGYSCESVELTSTITYVGPTVQYHDPVVTHPLLTDHTFCRYPLICGDADDNGIVNISDAVYIMSYVFAGGPEPQPYAAGDVDCNEIVNISDAVYLITYIFGGGPEPCAGCP